MKKKNVFKVLWLIPALLALITAGCTTSPTTPAAPTATRTSTAVVVPNTATVTRTSTLVVVNTATLTSTNTAPAATATVTPTVTETAMDTATATATGTTGPVILVPLGSAAAYGIFGGSAGTTNMGVNTRILGELGTTGASSLITGFHDIFAPYTETTANIGEVTGTIIYSGLVATAVLGDVQAAYNYLAGLPAGPDAGAGHLGGLTLYPGTYTSASGTFDLIGSDLTLDGQGNTNSVFVFQMAASLTVGDSAACSVKLQNGALAKNVYWQVGSSAVINYAGGGIMEGIIIANTAGITFSAPPNATSPVLTVLNGSALSLNASVTVVNTIVTVQ